MTFVLGIIGVIIQLALLVIVFSIPWRFREQREYMEQQKLDITNKLYALQKTQDELLRLVEALQNNDNATNTAPHDQQNH